MMKMKTILGVMASAAVCALALAGCSRESMEKETGEVKFSFSSVPATTRTEFQNYTGYPEGVTPTGQGITTEQVNWVIGDVVTICSDKAAKLDGTTHESEYEVSSVDGRAGDDKGMLASVDNHGTGGGLRWADETSDHKFFAVYGSPASISMADGVTGANIPANQALTWNNDNTVGKTPMTYAYMVGLLKTKYQSQVVLPMRQMYTAFQFTVSSGDNAEVALSTFTLSSTSTALAGGFTVAYPGGENPVIDNLAIVPTATAPTSSTPSTITVNFPDGFKVVSGKPVTFTVLALGQALTDLSITFVGEQIGTRTLALNKNNDQPITFSPSTKNLINGLSFPNLLEATGEDIIWEQTAIGENIEWLDDSYVLGVRDPYDLTYKGGSSETGGVISYRIVEGNPVAAAWTVVGYYDTREAAENAPSDDPDHTSYPTWINSYPSSGSGAASQTGQSVHIEYLHSDVKETEKKIGYEEINAEIASSTFGIGSSPDCYFNLAYPENKLSDKIIESANSYVINGPGYYRIPMVMGNGVKNNALYTGSYTKVDAAEAKNFKNHADAVVSNPLLQKSNGTDNAYTLASAYVVWESTNGLIEATGTDYQLVPVQNNSPFTKTEGTLNGTMDESNTTGGQDVYWLNFHVAKGEQGNAVIAVTDGTYVLWSYHIWVTNYVCRNERESEDISVFPNPNRKAFNNESDVRYTLMPINLGWLYEGQNIWATEYYSNTMYVKILQAGSNKTTVMEVKRPGHHVVTKYGLGNAPFYQWGRKDPFMPTASVLGGRNKVFTTVENIGSGVTFATGIKNPHTFYSNKDNDNTPPWSSELSASNIWSAKSSQLADHMSGSLHKKRNPTVYKTIYDPCPAGYSVPVFGAFSYRTDDQTGYFTVDYDSEIDSWKNFTRLKYKGNNFYNQDGVLYLNNMTDYMSVFGVKDGALPDRFDGFEFYSESTVTYNSWSAPAPIAITFSGPRTIYLPASGFRSYYDGSFKWKDSNNGYSNGARGYYWSALAQDGTQSLAFDIEHYWNTQNNGNSSHYFCVKNWSHFPVSDGCSIRPMQNDN